jgi:S1-C subfamily serine protease
LAQDVAVDDLAIARARAVRAAVAAVADSVVLVELVGVESTGGEIADDAPTVAIAVDDQRHFITSSMVVRGNPTSILLVAGDGRRVVATAVARDYARELVLLRSAEDVGVPSAKLSDVEPRVGQMVVAIGRYAGGQTAAISTGILSATGRNWGLALQTDARVSSAFYGGPLVDLRGRVIGVIVPMVPDGAGEGDTSWYDSGIAFAIDSPSIAARLKTLIDGTDIRRGLIGVANKESNPYAESTEIAAVRIGSPAARAGIEPGDRIVAIDSVPVTSHRAMKQILGPRDAGSTVEFKILRGDETITKTVRLAESIPPLVPQRIGISVGLSETVADGGDGEPARLVITGVIAGSPGDGKLQNDDVIATTNGVAVADIGSLRKRIVAADPAEPLKLGIVRGGESLGVEIQTSAIRVVDGGSLPDSMRYSAPAGEKWSVADFDMPDIGNPAAILAPTRAAEGAADVRDPGDARSRLGLMIVMAEPGEKDLKKLAASWSETAEKSGVVVCVIGPTNEDRWTPEELDVPQRIVAAIRQNHPIDSAMQVITGAASGSGGTIAMATALMRPETFRGLRIPADVRPPGMRPTENDPSTPLQIFIPKSESDDEPPAWIGTLEKGGYTVLAAPSDAESLFAWVRSLAAI